MTHSPRKILKPTLANHLRSSVVLIGAINLVFGIAAFYIVGLTVDDSMIQAVTAFLLSTAVAVFVGLKVTRRVTRPIEIVHLAAQTLDRNPASAVPTESGAAETDDLLTSLIRSNRQLSAYIDMMEAAANGNSSDLRGFEDGQEKLVTAFQKLSLRAAESIGARGELEGLRSQLAEIERSLSESAHVGKVVAVDSGDGQIVSVIKTINDILERHRAKIDSFTAQVASSEVQYEEALRNVRNGLLAGETSTADIDRAVSLIKSGTDKAQLIAEEFMVAQQAAERLGTSFTEGTEAIGVLTSRVTSVQRQLNELNRKLRKLRERTQPFASTARSVEDLARRSNLIAINSSLGTNSRLDPSTYASEFTALADRAQRVQKELSSFENALEKEIDDTESMIRYLLTESADLFVHTGAVRDLIDRIEPVVAAHSGLNETIDRIVDDSAREREELLRSLSRSYFEVEKIAPQLSEAERSLHVLRSIFDLAAGRPDDVTPTLPATTDPLYESHSRPLHRFEVPGEN